MLCVKAVPRDDDVISQRLSLNSNSNYVYKTYKNTIWIHIELRSNSRTNACIYYTLMITQYESKHVESTANKQLLIQLVSILFFGNIIV
jgi:tRNA splicing ligase